MLIIILIYFVCFLIWLIASTVVIYQGNKYYEPGSRMKLGIYSYVVVSIIIILVSFYFLSTVDWSAPISINFKGK